MLAVLAHEVVDRLSKQGLDAGICIERKQMERTANGWAKIANYRLLTFTRLSLFRERLGVPLSEVPT